jgi:hypothetical protein
VGLAGPIQTVGGGTHIGACSPLIDDVRAISIENDARILLLLGVVSGLAWTGQTRKETARTFEGEMEPTIVALPQRNAAGKGNWLTTPVNNAR